jgi:hypothetical protein
VLTKPRQAFNWVAAQDSDTQLSLLVSQELLLTESRNDGKAFQKTVAIASMTFLPASFLTVSDKRKVRTKRSPHH